MRAMVLNKITSLAENRNPLTMQELPIRTPQGKEILIKVTACGVCHTELDEIEGRLQPKLPIIPGHQIIGYITEVGKEVNKFKVGDRVGIGWIHSACGECEFCIKGDENLCDKFVATGKDVDGGYGEYTIVTEDYAFPIPKSFSDSTAAPLLCAGAIGYRSLRLCNPKDYQNIGLVGFGSSAHIVIQLINYLYPNSKVHVFARSEKERAFAKSLGAYWAGAIEDLPPVKLHSLIDTTPAWKPIVYAMKYLQKGGRLVINAIRKEEYDKNILLSLDYPTHLWLEKEIKSVANVTRRDIAEFLKLANQLKLNVEVQEFSLEDANLALCELKDRKIRGSKVLVISS